MSVTIAVDAMGGDLGPRVTIPAAKSFARLYPAIHLFVVGPESQLTELLSTSDTPSNISFLHAPDTVAMTDKPAQALRSKQESSLWKVIELVASGKADACVSAGNTGAMMAIGKVLLKTFPGIDRPAICKTIPTATGHSYMLDLGANVECSAEQLVQFALMGSELSAALDGVPRPTIKLLNIGAESIKGNDEVRAAAALMADNIYLNFTGFVEGDGIYRGDADVIVCDGFVGNVALKVSEGVAHLLATELQQLLKSSWYGRIVGCFARPLLRKWHNKFDPARYNGASFLGLQRAVVKSHGSSSVAGFCAALEVAREQVEKNIPERIHERLARVLG